MKTMKELLPKPSDAVWAMVNGLVEQSKREDFVVEMSTFGDYKIYAFGCAATCAAQQATGINLNAYSIVSKIRRADNLDIHYRDLIEFEEVIDGLRKGIVEVLFRYYNIQYSELEKYQLPALNTVDWKYRIDQYAAFAEYLQSLGL